MAFDKTKNLIPLSERTPEEKHEICVKAGIKSGQVKRERKKLKEELLILLSEGNTQEKVSLALIAEALGGNVKAFEVLRDTIGEKEPERIINEKSPVDDLIKSIDELKNK